MALDPTTPDEDPYFTWARQQQLLDPMAQVPPPLDEDAGRKGGTSSGPVRHIGPALTQGSNEIPLTVTAPPDLDAATDTSDPRGDMDADELADAQRQPDAMSGAGPAAGISQIANVSTEAPQDPNAAPDPTTLGFNEWSQQHAAGEPLPSMQQNDAAQSQQQRTDALIDLAKNDPEKFTRVMAERDADSYQKQVDAKAKIDAEDHQRSVTEYQMRAAAVAKAQQDTQQVLARAKELADTKIVRPKASIANAIGIVLGGMFSQNGQNVALQQFNQKINQDIAIQQENLANGWKGLDTQKGAIADEYARSGDLYHAQETYRLAAYQSAINDMQTELQKYDPAGTKAQQIVGTMQQFHNAQAQSAMALDKYNVDRAYKQAQTAQAVAAALKTQQETAGLKAKQMGAGGPAAVKPDDVPYPVAAWVQMHPDLAKIIPPTLKQLSQNELNRFLDQHGKVSATAKAVAEEQAGDAATTVSKPHGDYAPIVDKNGSPVRIAPDVAKELNEQNASAQNVVSDLNDVKRMLEEDPSTVDRKTWAEIQARVGQTLPAIAGYYKSKFSSREEEAIKDITNLDFDSYLRRFKDKGTAVASIDAIVDTVKRSVDTTNSTTLHAPVSGMLSDIGSAPKPKPTEVDQIIAKLSTSPHEDDDAPKEAPRDPEFAAKLAQQRDMNRPKPSGPGRKDQDQLLDRAAMFAASRVAPLMGRYYLVDDAGREIKGVPPVETEAEGAVLLRKYRDAARAGLAKLAGDAEDSTVRQRAGSIVQLLSAPDEEAP